MIAGKPVTAQCAGLVLAYSRRLFIQYYPRFTPLRGQTLPSRGGAVHGRLLVRVCVIDNTSVIVADGTGADAVIAPEMVAFARTLGFRFQAHGSVMPIEKVESKGHFLM